MSALTPVPQTPATNGWLEGSGIALTSHGWLSEYGTPGGVVPVLDTFEADVEIEQAHELDAGIGTLFEFGAPVSMIQAYNAQIERDWSGLAGIELVIERDAELIEEVSPDLDVFEFGAPIALLCELSVSVSTDEDHETEISRVKDLGADVSRTIDFVVSLEYRIAREVEA